MSTRRTNSRSSLNRRVRSVLDSIAVSDSRMLTKKRTQQPFLNSPYLPVHDAQSFRGLEESAVDDLEEREEVRRDLKRDLRRDLRMSHMGTNARKSKMERDSNRDVSEQIALGKQVKGSQDSLFDQRLFNQSQGMSSGFGAADSYNAYDKPLFDKAGADRIYRPSKEVASGVYGDDIEAVARKSAGKFQPDRGFKGAETTTEAKESVSTNWRFHCEIYY